MTASHRSQTAPQKILASTGPSTHNPNFNPRSCWKRTFTTAGYNVWDSPRPDLKLRRLFGSTLPGAVVSDLASGVQSDLAYRTSEVRFVGVPKVDRTQHIVARA